MKFFQRLLLILAILLIPLCGGLIALRSLLLSKVTKSLQVTTPRGINWSGFVNVNDSRQWVLIRGDDSTSQIILYLHGGPGIPETPMALPKYSGELQRHFMMVFWEQRGAGKSFDAGQTGTLTMDQYVNDALSVTRYLSKRFSKDKIFLIGHSWGTVLGIKMISAHPELFRAYIGTGQVVNILDQERLSLHFCQDCLKSQGNIRALKKLSAIGEPPYRGGAKSLLLEREYLFSCRGGIWDNYSFLTSVGDLVSLPWYSAGDLINYCRGSHHSLEEFFKNGFWATAFDSTNTTFQVPVALFIGRHDYLTPFALAERYYGLIRAPVKATVCFDQSAHMVSFEEPRKFQREVIRFFGTTCSAGH